MVKGIVTAVGLRAEDAEPFEPCRTREILIEGDEVERLRPVVGAEGSGGGLRAAARWASEEPAGACINSPRPAVTAARSQ
jgi:hypothetical protein